MNILKKLQNIAETLDRQGDSVSSDIITNVMIKVGQNTPLLNDPFSSQNPSSPLDSVSPNPTNTASPQINPVQPQSGKPVASADSKSPNTQAIITGITKAINLLVARKNPEFGKEGDPSTYQKCTDAVYDYLFAQSGVDNIPDAFNPGKFVKRSSTAITGILDKLLKSQISNNNYSLIGQLLLQTVNLIKSSKEAVKTNSQLKSNQKSNKHVYNIYLSDNFTISKIDSINTDGSVINSHLNTAWDKALGSNFLQLYKNESSYILGGVLNINIGNESKPSKISVGPRGAVSGSDISTIFEINNPQISCGDGSYIQVNRILAPPVKPAPRIPVNNAPPLKQRDQYPVNRPFKQLETPTEVNSWPSANPALRGVPHIEWGLTQPRSEE